MRKLLIVLLLAPCLFFIGCGYRIEQEVRVNSATLKPVFATWVYRNGKLLEGWEDEISIVTNVDSIKAVRYAEATIFIKKCKELEK